MMARTGVYAALAPQGVAVMDTRRGRGRWRFLDPIGAQLWLKITTGTAPTDAIEALTAHWKAKGADPDQVRGDLTALTADLASSSLLEKAVRPTGQEVTSVRFTAEVPVGAYRVLVGHLALSGSLVLLRCLPVRFALTVARAATRLPGRTATAQDAEIAVAAVRCAARWWLGRAACIEEALAAHLAAALTGRRVTWVLGARFAPNAAHAWIEAAGHIIAQDPTDRVWPYVPALKVERSH